MTRINHSSDIYCLGSVKVVQIESFVIEKVMAGCLNFLTLMSNYENSNRKIRFFFFFFYFHCIPHT
jgi:hypothetical protein